MTLPKVPQRTTPGFAFSMLDRALRECLGRRLFGEAEIQEIIAFFGRKPPECVYCGAQTVRRWDHLVSIRSGGETVIGNIVPACSRCDDAKQDLPFAEWMLGDGRSSPRGRGVRDVEQRLERIRQYVVRFSYVPRQLEERLEQSELERLTAIRLRMAEIRKEIESLIDDYRARTEDR